MENFLDVYEVNTDKKWVILKDSQGNIATGPTYEEALGYLLSRRKIQKEQNK